MANKRIIKFMFDRQRKIIITVVIILTGGLLFSACDTTSSNEPNTHYYEFTMAGESGESDNFIAKTSDPEVIKSVEAQLAMPQDERNVHINGEIMRGNADYNKDWSWHFVSGAWSLAENSIEVCDGKPQMVEKNIDYWVDQVGRFCPWSSIVLREANPQ